MKFKKFINRPTPVVFLLLGAFLLRIPLLSSSFWLDEAAQALESARPFSQQLLIKDDFQPPLLHLLLHFAHYFSNQEWWLRTVGALIPGIITIYFTYKIGTELKNKTLGILAAGLLATSSFHIFYSQELRQYSLPAMLATISWYLLLRINKQRDKFPWNESLVFALISAAGLFSSYLYPFVFITQALFLLIHHRQQLTSWLKVFALSSLLFLPWLPSFLEQLQAGTELQSDLPGWGRVVSPTQIRALPLVVIKFVYGVLDVEVSSFYVVFSIILVTLTIFCLFQRKHLQQLISENKLILWWLVFPVVSAWLISFWVPVLQPKRILYCLPAFYLLAASLASAEIKTASLSLIAKKIWKYPGMLLITVLLVINLISTASYWTQPSLQRENWRDLVKTFELKYPKRAVAIFSFPEPFAPWRWYADPSYPVLASGELFLNQETTVTLLKAAHDYDFVITFDYLRDLTDPEHKLNQQLISYGYKEIEVIDYPVIGFVRIYSKPEAVISYR